MIYDRAENWFIDLFLLYILTPIESQYNVMKVYIMVEQLTIYGVRAF